MQTPKLHWTAYLWPGLPQLWNQGSWVGLAVAVGFTALANSLLLATLVYTEWLTSQVRLTGLGVLAVVWLMSWWLSRGERSRSRVLRGNVDEEAEQTPEGSTVDPVAEQREEMFREAQQRYLENDWVATEQLLLKLLKQDARDVEGRLMLATLWRHQGRDEEALRQLDRLERLEAASTWKYEIEAEREALDNVVHEDEPKSDDQTGEIDNKITDDNDNPADETNRRLVA